MKIKLKVINPKSDINKEAMKMKHKMNCPVCNKEIEVTIKELSSKQIKCPKCGAVINITHKK
jgi:transcription elongation factor Elf1